MMIHEVTEKAGRHKRRKRIGRGPGSGTGKTAGRGHKGFGSRSGNSNPHEGGQIPFYKRFPKRGFTNAKFRVDYEVVNLRDLEQHFDAGTAVDADALAKLGLVRSAKANIKVLAYGELTKKLDVTAAAFSGTAKEKIESTGGTATVA
ncbi:MAG: 50S ribosomal protein L15 [Planctomycetota bacterium]